MVQKRINIKNKKVRFEYEILDKYTAGIVLVGTEIKSIREGKATLGESFCEFNDHDRKELFVINMYIDEYTHATYFNHQARRERKLLLNKKELKKLHKEVNTAGLTIVPLRLYLNEKGFAKLEIALCRGKKIHDKRNTLRDRDNKRDLARIKKNF